MNILDLIKTFATDWLPLITIVGGGLGLLMKNLNKKFEKIDQRFERQDSKFDELRRELKEDFRQELGEFKKEFKEELGEVKATVAKHGERIIKMQGAFEEIKQIQRITYIREEKEHLPAKEN